MNKPENRNYDCSVLGKKVTLVLEYASIPGVVETLNGFNCKNACVECGVVKISPGSQSYNWNNCPAYAENLGNVALAE
ncbi:MAG: hypothetical protein HOP36_02640 [Methyloglobulus sp.]|nr:hypothetical protein [Methyloglobulus sp.]